MSEKDQNNKKGEDKGRKASDQRAVPHPHDMLPSLPPKRSGEQHWVRVPEAKKSAKDPLPPRQSERELVRAKLSKAGVLVADLGVPRNLVAISDEELERSGDMRPGARSSEDLVSEDRGD
jgi:hypothetical protein